MVTFLRSISDRTSFLLVLAICFSLPLFMAVNALVSFANHAIPIQCKLTNDLLFFGNAYLLCCLGVAIWICWIRGISIEKFGLNVTWRGTITGLFLGLILWWFTMGTAKILYTLHPQSGIQCGMTINLPIMLFASTSNSIFEETMESGYLVYIFQRYGLAFTVVSISSFVALLHAYEGINYVIIVFLGRALFVTTYWRLRQLWPMCIGHFVIDILGLYPLLQH